MTYAIRSSFLFKVKRLYSLHSYIRQHLKKIELEGLYKEERVIDSEISNYVKVNHQKELLLCSNNYLGLSSDSDVKQAAIEYIKKYGAGLSSVRFICGTQSIHKTLEKKTSEFLGTEDTILYSSCFDANAGVFEVLLSKEDAVISDELNHASIIDGIRLSKAMKYKYKNCDMKQLESILKDLRKKNENNNIIVATDSVFSMDGVVAPLDKIVELCSLYKAMVFVDECHSTGVMGQSGRGCIQHFNVTNKVDIINSTYGKALGGASGGFTSGKKEIIELLRQKSRPYLFSNSMAPASVGIALKALDIINENPSLIKKLKRNTNLFQNELLNRGFELKNSGHPITPIIIGDAKKTKLFAQRLKEHQIYVVGFSYPVVPKDLARIRIQISACLSEEDIMHGVQIIEKIGRELQIINK